MDNLTHSLTGLFLSRAGLNRFSPHANWLLVMAANAPDGDVVSAFGGAQNYLNYHRHLTHSLALLPVIALLPVLIIRVFSRKPLNWKRAYLASLAGVASHLALDLTNMYGVRLALPFSGRWYRLDITNIVDVWIWGALILSFAGPLLARLVQAEIGAPRTQGRGFAIFALSFLLLYNGARSLLHARAVAVLDSRIYAGEPPVRVAALPGPLNPLRWRGIVETRTGYGVHEVQLGEDFDPARGQTFPNAEPVPAIQKAWQTQTFQDFLRFSQYPFWRVMPLPEPKNAQKVEVMDMRFGSPAAPGFVATAIVNEQLEVVKAWFSFEAR